MSLDHAVTAPNLYDAEPIPDCARLEIERLGALENAIV